VVHVDVPETIMNGKVKADVAFWAPHQYRHMDPVTPTGEQVARAAQLLIAAEAPMIHAGSGIIHAGAYDALRRVAELLHAPLTTSWAARGLMDETSPLAITMPHVKLNHTVRNEADVALIIGTRVGETDWWGKPPYWRHPSEQKTIQVDIDGDMLGLNKPADLAILADAKRFLELLGDELERRKTSCGSTAAAPASPATAGPCRRSAPAGRRPCRIWRCRCIRPTSARPAARCSPRIRCWWPTAATPPSGPCSTTG
jgi:acetolactate synthase-1/2/3 large subunit